MKVKVAPIKEFAAPTALSRGEWEQLGRVAVRVEEELGAYLETTLFAHLAVVTAPMSVMDFAREKLANILLQEGMHPDDWFLFLAPVLPVRQMPDRIENWVLHLRLMREVKERAVDHRPTLVEQFSGQRQRTR